MNEPTVEARENKNILLRSEGNRKVNKNRIYPYCRFILYIVMCLHLWFHGNCSLEITFQISKKMVGL